MGDENTIHCGQPGCTFTTPKEGATKSIWGNEPDGWKRLQNHRRFMHPLAYAQTKRRARHRARQLEHVNF